MFPTATGRAATTADRAPWLIDLNAIQADQLTLVGSKALNLGRLAQSGQPVPPGFCITSEALQEIAADRLSGALHAQLLDAWRALPSGPVAVRSSAVEEDQAGASWAGLFNTCLNVDSEQQLLDAVIDCWRSLHSDQVNRFRHQRRSQSTTPPRLAVIVQLQVEASAAGVLFTRDPLHPHQPHSSVNALFGLGEALVSGHQRGDRYLLDHQGQLLDQQLQCQRERLSSDGWHKLLPEQGNRSTLTPAQLRELVQVGKALEALFEHPQDIEFAYAADQLWLLQSRPIVANRAPDDDALARYRKNELNALRRKLVRLGEHRVLRHGPAVLSNGNIGELLPLPTPMSFALFQHIFTGDGGAIPRGRMTLGYNITPRATRELFTLVAGQPYFHLELDARTYDLLQAQPVAYYLNAVRTEPVRANYPEFGLYQQCPDLADAIVCLGESQGPLFARECRRHGDTMSRYGRDYYQRFRQRIEPELERHRLSMEHCDPCATSQSLLIRISVLIQHLQQVSCYHFVIAARLGFYFAERVRSRLQKWLPDECATLMGDLLQALPGSRITEQLLDLGSLQRGEISQNLFVRRYGHMAMTELEIALPRYHEAPEQLERLTGIHGDRADSRAQFREQLRQRKGVERRLRQRLQDAEFDATELEDLFRDLRLARRYLPLRETIKYHFAAEYDLLRRALLTFADTTGLGREELFYLEPAELPMALKRQGEALRLIDQRRQQHQLAKALAATQPLASVIFGDRLEDAFNKPVPAGGGAQWSGEGIAPGIRRGRMRLVDDAQDLERLASSLLPDDILVTRSANLGLAPLLRQVAGLVVEIGGFLAHAACQAREAGIPAVVLPGATKSFNEGQEVHLDGCSGVIKLI